jgi:hypothetical protein
VTNTGEMRFEGGQVEAKSTMNNAAGLIALAADATLTGNLTNGGSVDLAAWTGMRDLTVTGDFTQTKNGKLILNVDANQNIEYVRIGGNPNLDGSLQIGFPFPVPNWKRAGLYIPIGWSGKRTGTFVEQKWRIGPWTYLPIYNDDSGSLILKVPKPKGGGGNVNAIEGSGFSGIVGNFTDPGAADPSQGKYQAQIDWGDGSTSTGSVVSSMMMGFAVNGSHVYAEEGSYQISVTIADAGGSTATAVSSAYAMDAPLSATGQDASATVGVPFTGVVAAFSDANRNATAGDFSATIVWWGGSSTGTITGSNGSFQVVFSQTFADAGTVPLSITINDAGGASALTSANVTVNNP